MSPRKRKRGRPRIYLTEEQKAKRVTRVTKTGLVKPTRARGGRMVTDPHVPDAAPLLGPRKVTWDYQPKPEVQVTPDESTSPALQRRRVTHEVQRYHVRARFRGDMEFICPFCGCMTTARMLLGQFEVVCALVMCRAKFVPKVGLLFVLKGPRTTMMPGDYVLPDVQGPLAVAEAFPMGDLGEWKRSGCVHEYLGSRGGINGDVGVPGAAPTDVKEFVKEIRDWMAADGLQVNVYGLNERVGRAFLAVARRRGIW